MPNPELKKALTRAKALNAGSKSRIHFTLVLKGSTAGILLAGPRKISGQKTKEAKEKLKGTAVVHGTCFADDGTLVFETKQKPPASWNNLVKKLVRRETGLHIAPQFRAGKPPEEYDEEAELPDDPGAVEEAPGAEARRDPAGQWPARFAEVQPVLKEALKKGPPERAKRLSARFQEANSRATQGDHEGALKELDMIESLAEELLDEQAPDPETPPDYGWAFAGEYVDFWERYQALKQKDAKRAADLLPKVQRVRDHGKNQRFQEGLQLMEEVDELIEFSSKTQDWREQVQGQLGTYQVGKVLGKGGQGTVNLLSSQVQGAPVLVVKTAQNVKELKKEVKIYEQVGDHPNIARCLGMMNLGGGKQGMVMEALSGGDMKDAQTKLAQGLKDGAIKQEDYWGTVQYTLIGMLQGLDYMQSKGLAHCDIKPQNVMYDADGQVKIVDMGGAAPLGQRFGAYTPGYADPELHGNTKATNPTTDAFSTGATAYAAGEGKSFKYNALPQEPRQLKQLMQDYRRGVDKALHRENSYQPASQVDQDGKRKKTPGRFGAETAYVEFVNRLMDPDPQQRLTLREALEHPFLRDRLLSDEEAQKVIRSLNAPPQQQPAPQAAPPAVPKKVKAAPGRDIAQLRPQIADMLGRVSGIQATIALFQSKFEPLRNQKVDVPGALAVRAAIAELRGHLIKDGPDLATAIEILQSGLPSPVPPDDAQALQDAADLRTLQEVQDGLAAEIKRARLVESRIDDLVNGQGVKEMAKLARKGKIYTQAEIAFRTRQFQSQRTTLQNAVNTLQTQALTFVDQRLPALARLQASLQQQDDQTAAEETGLRATIDRLVEKSQARLTRSSTKAAVAEAVQRLSGLLQLLTAYRADLQRWQRDLAALEQHDNQAVRTQWDLVKPVIDQVGTLVDAVQPLAAQFHEKSTAFQAAVKERQGDFAGKRDEYFRFLQSLRADLETQVQGADALAKVLLKARKKFTPEFSKQGEDYYAIIDAAYGRTRSAVKPLSRLKTLIASDQRAYANMER